ncbi:MAG: hypothetical protein C4535_09345 [Comamonadaceae bacterium]|nr:MAG: hypothetical protein C4535_09345 [Comamonadaceae bacterium]
MNPTETPAQRLERNRAQARLWLEHDQAKRTAFAGSGLGQLASLPWIRQLSAHPVTGIALGALAKWWMKPVPRSSAPTVGLLAAGAGFSLLRRRPLLTTLVAATAVGLALLWARVRRLPPSP